MAARRVAVELGAADRAVSKALAQQSQRLLPREHPIHRQTAYIHSRSHTGARSGQVTRRGGGDRGVPRPALSQLEGKLSPAVLHEVIDLLVVDLQQLTIY